MAASFALILLCILLVAATAGQPICLAGIFGALWLVAVFYKLITVTLAESDAALRDSEARYRAVFDTAPDGIFTVNDAGLIESANQAACRIFCCSEGDIAGQHVARILPSLYAGSDEPISSWASPQRHLVTVAHRTDGSEVPIEVTFTTACLSRKQVVTAIVRDISERRELERRVGEFYSTVSHELRTPLTSIRGSLGLLEHGKAGALSPRAIQLVHIARSEADRLIGLINDILDIRKIEDGKLDLKLEPASPAEIVRRSTEVLKALSDAANVSLVADVEQQAAINCDKDRITQALSNLISNAIKFSAPHSRVVIKTETAEQGKVRFSIIDNGPGIPIDQSDKLFGLFRQVDSSDSRPKGGAGLGLAISKAIVQEHGGTIGLESIPGVETKFWFDLSLHEPSLAPEQSGSTARGDAQSQLNDAGAITGTFIVSCGELE